MNFSSFTPEFLLILTLNVYLDLHYVGKSSVFGLWATFPAPLPLEFCSAYENFGCCDQERDNSIAAKYWDIKDYMDQYKLCGTNIKDILCQVAGPGAYLSEIKNIFKVVNEVITSEED